MAIDHDAINEAASVLVDTGSVAQAIDTISSENPSALSTVVAIHLQNENIVQNVGNGNVCHWHL